MFKADLEAGEGLRIGDIATITLQKKSGKRARLIIDVDSSVEIERLGDGPSAAKLAATSGISGLDSSKGNYSLGKT